MSERRPDGTRVADYDYALPPHLVAQYPAARREEARLLTLRADGSLQHGRVPDLVDRTAAGDVLVVNESAVFPARLLGRKPTGAHVEVLLVRPAAEGRFGSATLWEALVRPGGKLKPGRTVVVSPELEVEIVDTLPSGSRVVRLDSHLPVDEALERYGHVPLPPYIDREDEAVDRERYQTVYARTPGSVAAPTAGLHLTEELLARLEARGVRLAAVTLHVGVGTFRPVEADDPADHEMHDEWYSVSDEAVRVIEEAREGGGRVWAVGTTAVRTLESAAEASGRLTAGSGETRLFVRPPHDFRVVDGLLTNFHLPRSTLLMLVAALAGYERAMGAYRAAVEGEYRFYSYGDAMLIEPGASLR
ncbi:MAG: tRNA preQ1(34) S-adenosylmethionine ribosyltransferase-isomerase QueA [Gemmatimonadetes bacterium]|nr:tRNA preQ1(34) S-adenosylmethionine ribosyltransferase-isomerase QueA [Gemmatimonadota bacterium]NNL31295.1 tRNA preQ1(34) S-adenosylmethionine ribosyltransferase-isomerase QueA [Gemmatimonadota bacterium]